MRVATGGEEEGGSQTRESQPKDLIFPSQHMGKTYQEIKR